MTKLPKPEELEFVLPDGSEWHAQRSYPPHLWFAETIDYDGSRYITLKFVPKPKPATSAEPKEPAITEERIKAFCNTAKYHPDLIMDLYCLLNETVRISVETACRIMREEMKK